MKQIKSEHYTTFLCNLINVINIEKLMWLTFIIFKLKLINKYGYISIYIHT